MTRAKAQEALLRAARNGDLEGIARALREGADANGNGEDGVTALLAAVHAEETKAIEALVRAGADPNDPMSVFGSAWTPLHQAASKVLEESAKALLEAGADVDARADGGMTPLMLAAGHPHGATARMLLEAGRIAEPGTIGGAGRRIGLGLGGGDREKKEGAGGRARAGAAGGGGGDPGGGIGGEGQGAGDVRSLDMGQEKSGEKETGRGLGWGSEKTGGPWVRIATR